MKAPLTSSGQGDVGESAADVFFRTRRRRCKRPGLCKIFKPKVFLTSYPTRSLSSDVIPIRSLFQLQPPLMFASPFPFSAPKLPSIRSRTPWRPRTFPVPVTVPAPPIGVPTPIRLTALEVILSAVTRINALTSRLLYLFFERLQAHLVVSRNCSGRKPQRAPCESKQTKRRHG